MAPPLLALQAALLAAFSPHSVHTSFHRRGAHPTIRSCIAVPVPEGGEVNPEELEIGAETVGVVVPTRLPTQPTQHSGWLQTVRSGYHGQRRKAAELLKKYGGAYILCSLSLSACSFSLFYFLVSSGIDVAAVLCTVGIRINSGASSRLGTVGVAYLLHKAASPLRFPPTVALTAVVGRRLERMRGVA